MQIYTYTDALALSTANVLGPQFSVFAAFAYVSLDVSGRDHAEEREKKEKKKKEGKTSQPVGNISRQPPTHLEQQFHHGGRRYRPLNVKKRER